MSIDFTGGTSSLTVSRDSHFEYLFIQRWQSLPLALFRRRPRGQLRRKSLWKLFFRRKRVTRRFNLVDETLFDCAAIAIMRPIVTVFIIMDARVLVEADHCAEQESVLRESLDKANKGFAASDCD